MTTGLSPERLKQLAGLSESAPAATISTAVYDDAKKPVKSKDTEGEPAGTGKAEVQDYKVSVDAKTGAPKVEDNTEKTEVPTVPPKSILNLKDALKTK